MNQSKDNIILIGMMGTGKSTVGCLLGEQLGYPLVDLDAAVEQEEGCSIASMFANHGEAYFRQAESSMLQQVLTGTQQVIATGGGAVLDPLNCEYMQRLGWVVALAAEVNDIVARVQGDGVRPLLADHPEDRVRTILEERKNAYLFADYTVDTSKHSAEEVASLILARYRV
ncbi:shikimate kinase [Paenibacillus sp. DS2015]|uniref:shikimate kinase n=1 Tax=Paenibacillus sp. DS2015 TaxID=3373917 RepID=UPI003D260DF2